MRARVRILLVSALVVLTTGLVGGLGVPATAGPRKPAPAPPPTGTSEVSVADLAVPEPADGSSLAVRVPVVLDRPASGDVRLRWDLVADSAGPADLTLGSGTATVRAGQQVTDVPTTVRGDAATEAEESATLRVTLVSGPATVVDDTGRVTVRDAVPGLSFGSLQLTEPDTGSAPVTVPAVHVPNASQRLSFRWSWGRGNRTDDESGADVTPTSPTIVSINRGAPGVLVPVSVVGDTRQEFDERWDVEILDVESWVTLADPRGEIYLPNDDASSWDTTWQPPAEVRSRPGSVLHVAGTPRDYVTQGQTLTFDSSNAGFTKLPVPGDPDTDVWNWVTITARGDVSYDVSLWTDPGAERIEPGVWRDVTRFPFSYRRWTSTARTAAATGSTAGSPSTVPTTTPPATSPTSRSGSSSAARRPTRRLCTCTCAGTATPPRSLRRRATPPTSRGTRRRAPYPPPARTSTSRPRPTTASPTARPGWSRRRPPHARRSPAPSRAPFR
ncbi:hypothetical protein [Nocardioides iriomotensis]|uniref:Calx-beta domain-containing protein n=1 Tax=Nocardioides iriomotensis TaxID=715784 RepID=A0A4V1Z2V3_9ACTN|nr:hypothetical protein [Nocardioides iriomotensis]RYU15706.1 hypothetical protein ETU37_00905 [Nocardioides iriomotensis]